MIVGDAIDKEPKGTWRHDPTAIPPELDLEFTENGPPDAQIGIYRLYGVYGETTKMLTIWFAQPGQDRLDGPSDKAARIDLENIDLKGLADGPIPADLTKARRKWQESSAKKPAKPDVGADDVPAADCLPFPASDSSAVNPLKPKSGNQN